MRFLIFLELVLLISGELSVPRYFWARPEFWHGGFDD